jgi:Predicted membrane protein
MKPVTGQYECVHGAGVGLEYFTARIDTLTLYADGHFQLKVQQRSRVGQAAQSLLQGQQPTTNVPENQQEGSYQLQGSQLAFNFANGGFEQGMLDADGTGLTLGPNHFTKVSDSTMLPSTHRMQQNMDDIAKGLKIAGTIGGFAMKAAKTIQSTIQTTQGQGSNATEEPQPHSGSGTAPNGSPQAPYQPQQQPQPQQSQSVPQRPVYQPQVPNQAQPAPAAQPQPAVPRTTLYCDQCGAHIRPGKRFCNNCGARINDA